MIKLPSPSAVKLAIRRMLRPRSRLGKTTLWFGGLALVLQLWKWAAHAQSGTMLSVWTALVTYVFVACLVLRGIRWLRENLMWRLRNRLIVTYVFIGVIPIVLILSMVLLAAYLFAGQFATYVALADLDIELQHLAAANNALAVQIRSLMQSGKLTPQLVAEIAGASDEAFRQRTVTVLEGDEGFVIQPDGKTAEVHHTPSEASKKDLAAFVVDDGRLHLRAVKHIDSGGRRLTVMSNVPMTPEILQRAARVGSVEMYPPVQPEPETKSEEAASQSGGAKNTETKASPESVTIDIGGAKSQVTISGKNVTSAPQNLEAGTVSEAANSFDHEFRWWSLFNAVDWNTGKELTGAIVVGSRPSMLYNVLFNTLGPKAGIFVNVLVGIAIFLGIIELVALFIGVRLTRSMTKSVAELYAATERVNRGDFSHRIQVRTRDQMAALETSFNSMSASLSKLIAEQKEKQRLESELAIAHEVQALLFPRQMSELSALEVHGVCRPARTVSGDYYDFIPLRNDRLVLAVGDISGKGISAALLMATVHAFVRAYSLEPQHALEPALLPAVTDRRGGQCLTLDLPQGECAPGSLMATLNYQLYRSTPPEKYATMFLGCYDGASRTLTYSNAGHLPPMVLCHDGKVRRLEVSGTVVGLFDGVNYAESRLPMHPGDIFVAFSDGVTEPENEFGEFGEDRLVDLIRAHREQPLARISEVLTGAVADWIGGNEQPDDVTLVLARAR
ncbi:MAG TPA: SpoIIE family protein phosphatase [Terriglobales bacterium]